MEQQISVVQLQLKRMSRNLDDVKTRASIDTSQAALRRYMERA